jgi:hypothetical protein
MFCISSTAEAIEGYNEAKVAVADVISFIK